MDKQAKLNTIREMRLSQIETLKELEQKFLQSVSSLNQPISTQAQQELNCIYSNLKKYSEKANQDLRAMDILEEELEK